MLILNDYIQKLMVIAKAHGNKQVVYSCDNEGSEFQEVSREPMLGHFSNSEFVTVGIKKKLDINAVCIN